jgi:hypothetical protein
MLGAELPARLDETRWISLHIIYTFARRHSVAILFPCRFPNRSSRNSPTRPQKKFYITAAFSSHPKNAASLQHLGAMKTPQRCTIPA